MRAWGDLYLLVNSSWVGAEPVTWDLVALEHLFSELLVTFAALDSVDFESMWVGVDIMVLCEEIWNWVECKNETTNQTNNNLLIWNLWSSNISEIFGNVMSHLWCWSWGTIFIFDHAIMELRRHSNNHVIEVWIEVSTFWDVKTERWVIVITSQ